MPVSCEAPLAEEPTASRPNVTHNWPRRSYQMPRDVHSSPIPIRSNHQSHRGRRRLKPMNTDIIRHTRTLRVPTDTNASTRNPRGSAGGRADRQTETPQNLPGILAAGHPQGITHPIAEEGRLDESSGLQQHDRPRQLNNLNANRLFPQTTANGPQTPPRDVNSKKHQAELDEEASHRTSPIVPSLPAHPSLGPDTSCRTG